MLTSGKALTLMGILYILSSALLGGHFFIGVGLLSIIGIILKILSSHNKMPPLSHRFVVCYALLGIVLLLLQALFPLNAADGFVNLLTMSCALKFMEHNSRRDSYVLVSALFFLAIVPLIFHYHIYILPYLLAIPVLVTWSFLAITHPNTLGRDLALISKILLPALPLTIVFFVIFPRVGALWVIPDNTVAQTGLTDVMTLDKVTELNQSDRLVARVAFEGDVPNIRYFQSLILDEYDGKTWRQNRRTRRDIDTLEHAHYLPTNQYIPHMTGNKITYHVMVEPSNTNILPVLKYSEPLDRNIFFIHGDTYRYSSRTTSRIMAHFNYYPDMQPILQPSVYTRQYLYLPPRQNPKTRDLVRTLIQDALTEEQKANAIYQHFGNNFRYTLQPGLFSYNAVDELLFQRQQGFCAHYAQAMAIMLRMANIPSRIVAGYLGGSENVEDNYITLRDYDAHAWVEAYIDKKWVRYDPTSLIMPSRLSSSLVESTSLSNQMQVKLEQTFYSRLKDYFDYIDYNWSYWVLNFDTNEQKNLFKESLLTIIAVIVVGFALLFLFIYLHQKKLFKRKYDKEYAYLLKGLSAIEDQGFFINQTENIEVFRDRLQGTPVEQAANKLINAYIGIRYKLCAPKERKPLLKVMKQAISEIKKC